MKYRQIRRCAWLVSFSIFFGASSLANGAESADEKSNFEDPTPYLRLNIAGHTSPINDLAFSPDSKRLYTAGLDKCVHVWELGAVWQHLNTWRWEVGYSFRGDIFGMAVEPKEGAVAIAGYGNRGKIGDVVWLDPKTGNYLASFFPKDLPQETDLQHTQTICSLAFSSNGKWFASADIDGVVLLWPGGEQLLQVAAKTENAEPANAGEAAIRTGDELSPSLLPPRFKLNESDRAQRVGNLNTDMRPIAFVGNDSLVFPSWSKSRDKQNIWQLKIARINAAADQQPTIESLPGECNFRVLSLAGSGDGHYLAAPLYQHGKQNLTIFEFDRGVLSRSFVIHSYPIEKNSGQDVASLAFSSDGRFLAAGRRDGENRGVVDLWDVANKKVIWKSPPTDCEAVPCAISPDGKWLAYATGIGNDVAIAEIISKTGQVSTPSLMRGGSQVKDVAFATDRIHGGDAKNYRVLFTKSQRRWIFDPAKEGDDRCRDLGDEKAKGAPEPYHKDIKNWSLRSVGINEVAIFQSGKPRNGSSKNMEEAFGHIKLQKDDGLVASPYRFQWICEENHPDGPPVAVAIAVGPQHLIKVFNVQKGECPLLRTFCGHEAEITSFGVSPDQKYLVSGAKDGTVAVWLIGKIDEMTRWGLKKYEELPNGRLKVTELDQQGPLYNRSIREGDVIERIEWPDERDPVNLPPQRRNSADDILDTVGADQANFDERVISFFTTRDGAAQPAEATPAYWQPLLMLYTHARDWIVWTPSGYYDASTPGGEHLIGWEYTRRLRQSPQFAIGQQYYHQFYQPRLIEHLLATADKQKAAAIAQVANPERAVSQQDLPEVKIVEQKTEIVPGKDPEIVIRAEVDPHGQPLKKVQLLSGDLSANTKLYECAKQYFDEAGRRFVEFRVKATQEAQRFAVEAEAAAVASSRETIIRPSPKIPLPSHPPEKEKMTLYVLAVGVSEYDPAVTGHYHFDNLKYAHQDAGRLASVFEDLYQGVYDDKVIVRLTTNAKDLSLRPNAKNIEDHLRELIVQMRDHTIKGNDTVIFYYAGHATLDTSDKENDTLVLIPSDGHVKNLTLPRFSGASEGPRTSSLLEDFCSVGICKRVLILDTCNSGAARGIVDRSHWHANVFTSCAKNESSNEVDLYHGGLFTHYVLRGLIGYGKFNLERNSKRVDVSAHNLEGYLEQIDEVDHPQFVPDNNLRLTRITYSQYQHWLSQIDKTN